MNTFSQPQDRPLPVFRTRRTTRALAVLTSGLVLCGAAQARQPSTTAKPPPKQEKQAPARLAPPQLPKMAPKIKVPDTTPTPVDHGSRPTPPYDQLIAQLGVESAAEREEALAYLAGDGAFTLAQLEETLRESTLSAEQRARLLEAAKQRYMASPRAAMGVQQFSRFALPERVVIGTTYPQFPSFQVLKEGDLILEVEGEKLRSRDAWNRLGAHIVSHDPGGSMNIIVRRGEEKLSLEVPLGSFKDLPGPNPLDIAKLERGWQLRSQRYATAAARQPIAIDVPGGKWEPGLDLAEEKRVRAKMQLPTLYRPSLVAGGDARGGELDYEEIYNAFNNNRAGFDQRLLRNMAQAGLAPMEFTGTTMTVAQELADLERTRDQIKASLQKEALPGNRNANQGLADLELGLQDRRKTLVVIEQAIKALGAEAAEMKEADVPTGPIPMVR